MDPLDDNTAAAVAFVVRSWDDLCLAATSQEAEAEHLEQ